MFTGSVCRDCGADNDTEQMFCNRCGAELEECCDEPEQLIKLDFERPAAAKRSVSLINVVVIFLVVIILAAIAVPDTTGRGRRVHARMKACMANMRVLQGAVEMYNMDNQQMIKHMDEETIDKLVEGKYLKGRPLCPGGTSSSPGVYQSTGDLAAEGVIFCSIHGTVESPVDLE